MWAAVLQRRTRLPGARGLDNPATIPPPSEQGTVGESCKAHRRGDTGERSCAKPPNHVMPLPPGTVGERHRRVLLLPWGHHRTAGQMHHDDAQQSPITRREVGARQRALGGQRDGSEALGAAGSSSSSTRMRSALSERGPQQTAWRPPARPARGGPPEPGRRFARSHRAPERDPWQSPAPSHPARAC